MKRCRGCNTEKEIGLFGRDVSRPDGRSFYCKPCVARQQAERRARRRRERELDQTITRWRPRPLLRSALTPRRLAPVLLEAIDQAGGSCTQLALFNHVHDRLPVGNRRTPVLLEDLIGETLARLFDQRAIGTSGTAERRRYFRRAA